MKKFAVAFISFFDNILTIQFVEAETDVAAARQVLVVNNLDLESEIFLTLEAVKSFCFDCDSTIDVKELPPC